MPAARAVGILRFWLTRICAILAGMKRLGVFKLLALSLAAAAMVAGTVSAAPPDRRCTCRNRDGAKYELGQVACIRIGDSAYMARCEMNLNVTTWKKLRDGCPTAEITPVSAPAY
jgi:hypothetical protein